MGIQLTVQERSTGLPVVANNLRAIASDGAYADTASVNDDMPLERDLYLVEERAGTYQVSVVGDGYLPWAQDRVRVTEDDCHVRLTRLLVQLDPL